MLHSRQGDDDDHDLDDLIVEIQETSDLSAAARNALHGALSTHPWGKGKTLDQRVMDVRCAIAGRPSVPGHLRFRLERRFA